jgi:23S rRNA (cytidine1920-2'-O)/16S rRNA (cytidine1409-2'-O)-methyltransferase
VVLVKPQFEVGPEKVGPGGVVTDPADRLEAIERARADAVAMGFTVVAGMDSPVAGARSGNVEHFLELRC